MAWIRWHILATLAVLLIVQSADAAGLIPGFPIPIPGVGTGVCTWDQFVGEMKKLQRTLAKNPIRYGGMAIALKQGLKKMQKNAPSELLPAVTILVPTNRALLAASLNPTFLIDLIQNKKKVQSIAKVNVLVGEYDYNTLKSTPKGQGIQTADSKKKVARYKGQDSPMMQGTGMTLGVVGAKGRAEVMNKDLFSGNCVVAQGISRLLQP
ncbi:unnamed protein product [Closterium sp. NIES-53]